MFLNHYLNWLQPLDSRLGNSFQAKARHLDVISVIISGFFSQSTCSCALRLIPTPCSQVCRNMCHQLVECALVDALSNCSHKLHRNFHDSALDNPESRRLLRPPCSFLRNSFMISVCSLSTVGRL